MKISKELFKNHRSPAEIIQYVVWLYFLFPLSFRDVELLLHQRGIVVSHEAIRAGKMARRKRPCTPRVDTNHPVAPNLLNRDLMFSKSIRCG